MSRIRPIAIVLPQFHPILENDTWWGKGFTEWRNVAAARPRFLGHYQPHIPADLGFYDLRLDQTRLAQSELAREYGIHGFCYYHYWFNGRRILEKPVDEILKLAAPDFPFMLCWANENWTRAWDGSENSILLQQNYSDDDFRAHAEHLMPYFKDERYIRVNGKPVFAIYKDLEIPDTVRMCEIFQRVAYEHGMQLYLCRFERRMGTRSEKPQSLGFDAGIEFQPLSRSLNLYQRDQSKRVNKRVKKFVFNLARKVGMKYKDFELVSRVFLRDEIINYSEFVDYDINQGLSDYLCYPGVSPSWDNSPRRTRGKATIFHGSTPEVFEKWVKHKVATFNPPSAEEDLLFINAWNEWAEGNHLEPCLKYGHRYLQALFDGVESGLKDRLVRDK
jgi:hypothetical protein